MSDFKQIKDSIRSLTLSMIILDKKFESKISQLIGTVDVKKAQELLVQIIQAIQTTNEQLQELERIINDYTEIPAEINSLQTTVNSNKSNIESLQTTVNDNSTNIESLQTTVNDNSSNIESLQANLENIYTKTEINDLFRSFYKNIAYSVNENKSFLIPNSSIEGGGTKNIELPEPLNLSNIDQFDTSNEIYYEIKATFGFKPIEDFETFINFLETVSFSLLLNDTQEQTFTFKNIDQYPQSFYIESVNESNFFSNQKSGSLKLFYNTNNITSFSNLSWDIKLSITRYGIIKNSTI